MIGPPLLAAVDGRAVLLLDLYSVCALLRICSWHSIACDLPDVLS
jgi:hypothetical protein